jgi:ribonuclease J
VVDPEVIARGFDTPDDDGEELLDAARDAVDEVLERCLANRMTEVNLLQQELHDALAPLVHRMTGKRPMVVPVVIEV